jgi:hypothetical protein
MDIWVMIGTIGRSEFGVLMYRNVLHIITVFPVFLDL